MKETMIETFSPEETHALGKKIGQQAKPGDVYTLIGDLGVGKTVFTQGIAEGLGIREPICSPTFTIVQVYEEGRMPFYHFDVYRIGDIEEMDEIGYEDNFMPEEVMLAAYQAILPSVKNILQCLICFNMPFTIVKGMFSVVITFLTYKHISPILKGSQNR